MRKTPQWIASLIRGWRNGAYWLAANFWMESRHGMQESGDSTGRQNGAEPVYGPAYGEAYGTGPRKQTVAAGGTRPGSSERNPILDAPAPPYTAPYPPYPSDIAPDVGLPTNIAAGLAYLTIIPAVFFLLLPQYRNQPVLRFHSWQSIFYFLAVAVVRVAEMVMLAMLPSPVAFAITSVFMLLLFAGWLIVVIKAFQGSRYLLPWIGPIAESTATTSSSKR